MFGKLGTKFTDNSAAATTPPTHRLVTWASQEPSDWRAGSPAQPAQDRERSLLGPTSATRFGSTGCTAASRLASPIPPQDPDCLVLETSDPAGWWQYGPARSQSSLPH